MTLLHCDVFARAIADLFVSNRIVGALGQDVIGGIVGEPLLGIVELRGGEGQQNGRHRRTPLSPQPMESLRGNRADATMTRHNPNEYRITEPTQCLAAYRWVL